MNYIKRLEADNADLCKRLAAYEEMRRALRRYLTSSKFYEDSTVQARDILNRIDETVVEAYYND